MLVVIFVLGLAGGWLMAEQSGKQAGDGVGELAQAHARRQQEPPAEE